MSKYLLVLAAFIVASPVYAELTTNMGAATKYMFRGVKQSDADIVINGGVDYNGPFGFYAGAWGYTGSLEDFDTSEVNGYGGFAYNLGNVALGAGVIGYERGGDKVDNTEYNVNLAWSDYRLSVYKDDKDTYEYKEVAANYEFWDDAGMAFTVGLLTPDETKELWNYSASLVLAMPSKVDFEVLLTNQQKKGYSLVLGISQQFDW
ncbi:MAG: hypothetical protein ACI8SR_003067 [Oceanicoccus sp.]|jgi:uncharacterized protein (TIGR02001 family)